MLKFLKAVPMTFPVNLVTYPALAVVAMFHGLFHGLGSVVYGSVANFGLLLLMPFAFPTTIRRTPPDSKTTVFDACVFVGAGMSFGAAALGVVINLLNFYGGAPNATNAGQWLISHWQLFVALGATQILSGLYELGRWYANKMGGAKASQSDEAPDAKVIAPQSYGTMISKIMSRDKWSQEEAGTLLVEVGENVKNDRMKLNDAKDALKMISDRAPTAAVVH